MLDRETPLAARLTLVAALAYFVTPFDFVPDFLLGLGFLDDASVLLAALTAVRTSIKEEHRVAARRGARRDRADESVKAAKPQSRPFSWKNSLHAARRGDRRASAVDDLVTKARKSARWHHGRLRRGRILACANDGIQLATMRQMRYLLSAAFAVTGYRRAGAGRRQADARRHLQQMDDLDLYRQLCRQGQGKVCYIYSEPDKMSPDKLDHGRVSFSVTSSPAEGIKAEANFVTGYPMKEQSSVTVTIGDKSFTMFTQGDSAWLVNKEEEAALLAAMKDGSAMVVKAVSRRGNETTYNYSLAGVTAAADKIADECK